MLRSKKIATIISYINLFASLLSTVFFIPFLLKRVGDDYGVFSFSESIISWLTMLSTTFASCYVRFATIEEKKTGEQPKQSNYIFLLLLIGVSVIALLSGLIIFLLFRTNVFNLSSFTIAERDLFYLVFLLAIIHSSIEIILSFFSLYTTYSRYFVVVRGALLINAILYPLLSVIALFSGGRMLLVIIIMYAVKITLNIGVMIFAFVKLHVKFKKISFSECKPLLAQIIVFSSYILINTIVETCNISLDRILLGAFFGAHLVAIYQLGMTYTTYINSISCALTNNFIPEIHKDAQDGNLESVNNLFAKISSIQFMVLFMVVGGYLACGYDFTVLWIGSDNIQVFFIAASLMIAFLFDYSTSISIEYQRSVNKHKFRAIIYLISLLFNFGITISLLVFCKWIDPIVSCLIGTIFSEIVFKTIILSLYNSIQLKMDYKVVIFRFIIVALLCFVSFSASSGFSKIILSFLHVGHFYSFLIRGFSFVLIYTPTIIYISKKVFKLDLFTILFKRK